MLNVKSSEVTAKFLTHFLEEKERDVTAENVCSVDMRLQKGSLKLNNTDVGKMLFCTDEEMATALQEASEIDPTKKLIFKVVKDTDIFTACLESIARPFNYHADNLAVQLVLYIVEHSEEIVQEFRQSDCVTSSDSFEQYLLKVAKRQVSDNFCANIIAKMLGVNVVIIDMPSGKTFSYGAVGKSVLIIGHINRKYCALGT